MSDDKPVKGCMRVSTKTCISDEFLRVQQAFCANNVPLRAVRQKYINNYEEYNLLVPDAA
jgi:hypothetical protein